MQQRLMSRAGPDPSVPAGSVRIQVVDEEGEALGSQSVILGVMARDGTRSELPKTTSSDGIAIFSDLSTDGSASYRARMVYQGATFASPPFRLSNDQGVLVHLVRLPVNSDERPVLQHGQFIMELRDQRLHVVQHARLSNFGTRAYVFPKEGKLVRLPQGFVNLELQAQMGDQRMVKEEGVGFRVFGSLVPGTITLSWSYHLPATTRTLSFDVPTNWNTYRYQIVIVAVEGLSLSVNGLNATSFEHEGRALLGTEIARAPQEAPLSSIRIALRGIPGPGPLRWIALGLAVCLGLGLSLLLSRRGPAASLDHPSALVVAKHDLQLQARMLNDQRANHEVGPQFYKREHERLVTEMAQVLRLESLDSEVAQTPPDL